MAEALLKFRIAMNDEPSSDGLDVSALLGDLAMSHTENAIERGQVDNAENQEKEDSTAEEQQIHCANLSNSHEAEKEASSSSVGENKNNKNKETLPATTLDISSHHETLPSFIANDDGELGGATSGSSSRRSPQPDTSDASNPSSTGNTVSPSDSSKPRQQLLTPSNQANFNTTAAATPNTTPPPAAAKLSAGVPITQPPAVSPAAAAPSSTSGTVPGSAASVVSIPTAGYSLPAGFARPAAPPTTTTTYVYHHQQPTAPGAVPYLGGSLQPASTVRYVHHSAIPSTTPAPTTQVVYHHHVPSPHPSWEQVSPYQVPSTTPHQYLMSPHQQHHPYQVPGGTIQVVHHHRAPTQAQVAPISSSLPITPHASTGTVTTTVYHQGPPPPPSAGGVPYHHPSGYPSQAPAATYVVRY